MAKKKTLENEQNEKGENLAEEVKSEEVSSESEESSEAEARLTDRIAELEAQSADYKDKWYRTAAEFENYKKRNAETRRIALEEGKIDTVKKILFIGDNLERALSYGLDEKTKEGIELLIRQYGEILNNLGLEVIDPKGEKFDPNLHEAIFSREAGEGEESGTVDSVFLKGYKLGDKMIRYAQVVVIK
ncbi:MAG: nucleotide exchange factor GrpE [Clostridia bacterium]|nr:nucleotide exchange factor GrpE [Clostridia bacterium]